MRYLKYILNFKLCLKGKDIALRGFCDADWTRDTNHSQSTTWYIFIVGVGVISWKCKKQPNIALSMTEAKHMATSYCMKETVWLKQFLADVEYIQK